MSDPKPPSSTDQLRQRIDSGQTGEKVDWPDPAAAPLGTDDEAGGHPATQEQLAMETHDDKIAAPQLTERGRRPVFLVLAILLVSVLAIGLFAMLG